MDLQLSDRGADDAERRAIEVCSRAHRAPRRPAGEASGSPDAGRPPANGGTCCCPPLHAVMARVGWISAGALDHVRARWRYRRPSLRRRHLLRDVLG